MRGVHVRQHASVWMCLEAYGGGEGNGGAVNLVTEHIHVRILAA